MKLFEEKFSKVGDKYHDFKIVKSEYIEELQCLLRQIEHEPSGATVVHIAADDPENVFCIALRTLPKNSNGVAHILEHTVLCGSKKFPVKDPFFSMNRRSLNTYMNALTGPDFTCYPAASQVPKDFYNLLEVYLDAVFHPELKELSFLQEGHRLEFAKPQDVQSALQFKGIVFNEMKGSLSSPMSRLWDCVMSQLFPDILYKHNFGGEPIHIPSLTYQGLKDFHTEFYQESRAIFYFYGNMPIEKHLDFLEKNTLKGAPKLESLAPNPTQPKFKKSRATVCGYPMAKHEDTAEKSYIALSWLTCPLKNQLDVLALQIIDTVLMGTDAAPLKIKLLQSGLCQNAMSVLEDELSQVPYCLVFEGTEKEQLEPIKELVFETLKEIISKPLDPELIEGALHQLEFSRTEINSDYGPFGLSLILKMVPLKNVDADLENSVKIHSLFEHLRKELKDPNYLVSFIQKYFVDNPHFTSTVLVPDKDLIEKETKEEQALLNQIEEKLDNKQKEQIVQKAAELKAFQEECEKQDLEVLPKVTLNDVSKEPRLLELHQDKLSHAKTFFHPCFTNGIVYQDICFKLPKVEHEDLPYVRLFAYLISQVGSNGRDYATNLNLIQNHTGGIASFLDSYISTENVEDFTPNLIFKGKALSRSYSNLVDLMYDMIASPMFDDESRLKELITQLFVEMDHDLKQSSLRYAVNLSCSGFYEHSYISYYWSGLGYYYLIKKIASNLGQEIPKLINKLHSLKDQLLHANDYDVITTCSEDLYSKIQNPLEKLCSLPSKTYKPWQSDFKPHLVESQARISSAPVFFTSMAIKTTHFTEPANAHLSVASRLMDNTYLHRVIREQGGAYGGGSSNKMSSAKFCFYAYRDPNLASTIQAFKGASEHIKNGKFSDRELEEAKLGIVQKLDHPIAPEYQGLTAYSWVLEGKDMKVRKILRERILKTSTKEIQESVDKYLLSQIDKATVVTFGSKEAIEKENQKLKEKKFLTLKVNVI